MSTLRDLRDPRLLQLPGSGPHLVIGKRAMRTGEELVEQRDHPAQGAWIEHVADSVPRGLVSNDARARATQESRPG
jgi:hypothetical protein